ncbi:hypothetical protein [Croceiramulus getboli]|nr:hypothetical protein P8624_05270 [Flavobacteriaceae bacterium YJPT1-3]
MAGPEVWEVANKKAAQILFRFTLFLLAIGLLLMVLKVPYRGLWTVGLLLAGLGWMIFKMELFLKNHFDSSGNRKF